MKHFKSVQEFMKEDIFLLESSDIYHFVYAVAKTNEYDDELSKMPEDELSKLDKDVQSQVNKVQYYAENYSKMPNAKNAIFTFVDFKEKIENIITEQKASKQVEGNPDIAKTPICRK